MAFVNKLTMVRNRELRGRISSEVTLQGYKSPGRGEEGVLDVVTTVCHI